MYNLHNSFGYLERKEGKCSNSLTDVECEALAGDEGKTFKREEDSNWPAGCYEAAHFWFNKATTGSSCDKQSGRTTFKGELPGSETPLFLFLNQIDHQVMNILQNKVCQNIHYFVT